MRRVLHQPSTMNNDEFDQMVYLKYRYESSQRYLFRTKYRKSDSKYWQRYLDPHIVYDSEFQLLFRMSRDKFLELLEKIMNHRVFHRNTGRPQHHVCFQLMMFLFYLGMSGDGAKHEVVGLHFHISKGAVRSSLKRVLTAILSMKDDYIKWPDVEERSRLADSFLGLHGFPNCIGAIDGTHIGLVARPSWCGQDFCTRKFQYAI